MKIEKIKENEKMKEEIKKMTDLVLYNCKNFFNEMQLKLDNNHPISLLEQQLIMEYTLAFLQVKAVRKQLDIK